MVSGDIGQRVVVAEVVAKGGVVEGGIKEHEGTFWRL